MHMSPDMRFRVALLLTLCAGLVSCAGNPQLRTYVKPGAVIDRATKIAVVPSKVEGSDDLVLPDAIATELLGLGLNVVEPTTLSQLENERGLDLTEILNGEEHFKRGTLADFSAVIIVNATIMGTGVANASVRVVDIATGDIIMSTSYSQPAPDNAYYAWHDTVLDTAGKLAGIIPQLLL